MKNGILAAVVVVAIGAIGVLAYQRAELANALAVAKEAGLADQRRADALEKKLAEQQQRAEALEPKWAPATDSLVSGSISVGVAERKEFRIIVDADKMKNVKIEGHFVASGGKKNDIEVFIFDEDSFTNWKNGNQGRSLYTSGRTTVGDIRAQLPRSGVYYVVFSNNNFDGTFRFQQSGRTVNADVKVSYSKLTNPS